SAVLSHKLPAQPPLAAVVVNSRRSEGDAHHLRRLRDCHAVVENQVQYLSLSPRQLGESSQDATSALVVANLVQWHHWRHRTVGMIPSKEAHGLEPAPPPHVERRLANDAEEPGSHRGPTVVARAPIQDFEVCRLQHVLSLLPPEATACQRPAVARRVKPFDLSLDRLHFLG